MSADILERMRARHNSATFIRVNPPLPTTRRIGDTGRVDNLDRALRRARLDDNPPAQCSEDNKAVFTHRHY